jgi:predicted dehydrogenase
MKKLGVAVVGTGFWGKKPRTSLQRTGSTNLVAICDV